jgi:uncharacterized protein (TIGR03067 family)
MKAWLATFVLTLSAVAAVWAHQQDVVPSEMRPLQGTWVMFQINGDAAPGDTALVIAGSRYSETVDNTVDETGLFKIDASKTPMTVDLIIQEGDAAGKTQLGIFDVKGNTMRLLLNPAGDARRPTSLEKADGELFIVAQRTRQGP